MVRDISLLKMRQELLALPRRLGVLYSKLRRYWLPDYFFKPTLEVLEGLTQNRELIGLLTAQWGDYGLPPAQSAFVMHAMVAKHYLAGGSYPVGGAVQMAETIIPVIEAAGGNVFTYAGVKQIIIENGRAVGVRLHKDDVELRAPQIVSCAGLIPTYTRLLPREIAESKGLLAPLEKVELSAASLCLYAGFKGSAAELGLLDPAVSDEAILAAMLAHPILVNRPIVVSPRGAALCRPSEVVLALLDTRPDSFTKEDGEVVL